jgi:hypothetical protein
MAIVPESLPILKPPPVRNGAHSAGLSTTPEKFDALPRIADPNDELGHLLRVYRDTKHGHHPDEPTFERHVPTTRNRRQCDRAIWAGLARTLGTKRDVPTIVAVFVSRSRHDYEIMRDNHLAAAVKECRIINRFRRVMNVDTRGDLGPVQAKVHENQMDKTSLLPGFARPLKCLRTQADAWSPPCLKERPKSPRPQRGS